MKSIAEQAIIEHDSQSPAEQIALRYLKGLAEELVHLGGSPVPKYYSMDRDEKYDLLLKVYGGIVALILNAFMRDTQADDWDGPEPLIAHRKTGEAILEEWAIEAIQVK